MQCRPVLFMSSCLLNRLNAGLMRTQPAPCRIHFRQREAVIQSNSIVHTAGSSVARINFLATMHPASLQASKFSVLERSIQEKTAQLQALTQVNAGWQLTIEFLN